uniref:Putative endochitinase 2 n=1 Tax=Melittobia sp. EOM-2016 TaxID=1775962 RepID=A0A0U3SNY4_9HYME|nr:putative endochitinase 2 [Melittobia sp. EOM-2016]
MACLIFSIFVILAVLNGCFATISRDEFNLAITVNGYAQPADSSIYTCFEEATRNYRREEIAMLLAQLIHESGGFQYREEIACKYTNCPGFYVDNVGIPGKYYYGRGFIQLTWGANYKAASQALGLGDQLLQCPEEVASNTRYAVFVSTWYWEARVRPVLGDSYKFGLTTKAINGAIECSGGWNERAVNRYRCYQKVADVMKIQHRAAENGCYN